MALCPVFLCIEDEQCYNGGELRAREAREVKGGNVLVPLT
jgi:hypothetical protein